MSGGQDSWMEQGYYVIFTRQGNNMCVGLSEDQTRCVLTPFKGDDSTTWVPQLVSGTRMFYLLHQKSGLGAYFADNNLIVVRQIYSTDDRSLVCVADVGAGYVAINNMQNDRVWDAYQESNRPWTQIRGHDWNGGDNQRWRFVPTTALVGY